MSQSENKRRLRTYSRRIMAMAGGDLKHPCFFMHVPKCGGTSVSEALYATVPMHKRVGIVDADATRRATALIKADQDTLFLYHDDLENGHEVYALREAQLLTHMAWNTSLIHGHIPFSETADRHFGDRYKYVTILRDPLARLISNYNGSVSHGLTKVDFDTYIEGDVARIHALSTLRYFTGTHHIAPEDETAAVDLSLKRAEKFAVIGFLDQLDAFCDQYGEVFGRRPAVFRYNEAKGRVFKPDAAQEARARALLAPEYEFWEKIRERHGLQS